MPAPTVFREVSARVHLSLPPASLSGDVLHTALQTALTPLLMRYHPPLRGVIVAHLGGLKLHTPPTFVATSPYAHLVAVARLLVFAPPRGAVLVGVVVHIGPDHVGLSVLQAFHGVLALQSVAEAYRYDYRVEEDGLVRSWKLVKEGVPGCARDVRVGCQVRFVVDALEPTKSGLFQIQASLDEGLRSEGQEEGPLGVLAEVDEVLIAREPHTTGGAAVAKGAELIEDKGDAMYADVIEFGRRAAEASRARGSFGSGSFGVNLFSDALMAGSMEGSCSALKKTRTAASSVRDEAEPSSRKASSKSVKFELSVTGVPDNSATSGDVGVPVLTQFEGDTPSPIKSSHAGKSSLRKAERKRLKDRRKTRLLLPKEEGQDGSAEPHSPRKKKSRRRERDSENIADIQSEETNTNGVPEREQGFEGRGSEQLPESEDKPEDVRNVEDYQHVGYNAGSALPATIVEINGVAANLNGATDDVSHGTSRSAAILAAARRAVSVGARAEQSQFKHESAAAAGSSSTRPSRDARPLTEVARGANVRNGVPDMLGSQESTTAAELRPNESKKRKKRSQGKDEMKDEDTEMRGKKRKPRKSTGGMTDRSARRSEKKHRRKSAGARTADEISTQIMQRLS